MSRPALTSTEAEAVVERYIFWFVTLTPLLWLLGLLLTIGLVGTFALFFKRLPRNPVIAILVALWFAVAGAQAVSAIVNWTLREQTTGELIHNVFSFGTVGWAYLGAALGAGAEWKLSSPRMIRALCIQAIWMLIIGVPAYAVAVAVNPPLQFPSLAALALPDTPIVEQQFYVRIVTNDQLVSETASRLVLFFPWSTALGFGALAVCLAAMLETNKNWRVPAILGGIVGLMTSFSRAAVVGGIVALAWIACARMSWIWRWMVILVAAVTLYCMLLFGWDPATAMAELSATFTGIRPGSSEARDLIYSMSWHAFLESPVFGYGGFSSSIATWLRVPLGSHSSFYGVLYTGGLVTFTCLVLAYLTTFAVAVSTCFRVGPPGRAAVGILFVLGIMAYGEDIQWFVPGSIIVFLWIGGVLGEPARGPMRQRNATATMPAFDQGRGLGWLRTPATTASSD